MKKILSLSLIVFLFAFLINFLFTAPLAAEDEYLAPQGIEGELVYIPYPVEINIDGDLSDWDNIERFTVDTGPITSGDPTDNGQFTFAICADMENIYVSMTMPDKKIIGGMHGPDF